MSKKLTNSTSGEAEMDLTADDWRFLTILADGKTKTYVNIARGFGQGLTPMAPTFTNRIASRLLRHGLIQRGGLSGGFRITEKGINLLRESRRLGRT